MPVRRPAIPSRRSKPVQVESGSPDFPAAADDVVRELRAAVRDVLAALPGSPQRAQPLADALAVDLNLAWKIINVVQMPDPFAAAQQLPGSGGLDIFLKAAGKAGAPPPQLDRCRAAFAAFDGLIVTHAGDRAALDSMLGRLASRGSERADLAARRAAYKAMSGIVGVQARSQINTYIIHPAADQARYDITMLRGFVGLQRLQRGLGWIVGRSRLSDTALPGARPPRTPLDPDAARQHDGVPLLSRSCAGPVPRFRRIRRGDGSYADELVEGPVGKTAAVTFFTGETVVSAGNRVGDAPGSTLRVAAGCHTPCETFVLDVLVHAELNGIVDPVATLASDLGGHDIHDAEGQRPSLPMCEYLEEVVSGLDGLTLPEHPAYTGLIESAAAAISVKTDDLRPWRLRVRFPPIPCSAITTWRVLDRAI